MNNFTLIHSFHFLNKQNYSLCSRTYNIVDENNNKLCLISNTKLETNYITLDCNHKFNFLPLYYEIVYQKNLLV